MSDIHSYLCGFIGQRNIPEASWDTIYDKITEEIELAVRDGFTGFVSGLSQSTDLLFAKAVVELKELHPRISLLVANPYANQLGEPAPELLSLLDRCDVRELLRVDRRLDDHRLRSWCVVQQARRIIAFCDGQQQDGTAATIRYAHLHEREVRMISL